MFGDNVQNEYDTHSLWTFKVIGEYSFALRPQGNPTHYHMGGLSVFNFMLTKEQAELIEAQVLATGCRVEFWQVETQTVEQHAERLALLGLTEDGAVYPSTKCNNCYWFDPMMASFCGREAWPEETIEQSLLSYDFARKDEVDCPVQVW